jgi:hypothetical protein
MDFFMRQIILLQPRNRAVFVTVARNDVNRYASTLLSPSKQILLHEEGSHRGAHQPVLLRILPGDKKGVR